MADKPHGPIGEHFMRHHYGAAMPAVPAPVPTQVTMHIEGPCAAVSAAMDGLREQLRGWQIVREHYAGSARRTEVDAVLVNETQRFNIYDEAPAPVPAILPINNDAPTISQNEIRRMVAGLEQSAKRFGLVLMTDASGSLSLASAAPPVLARAAAAQETWASSENIKEIEKRLPPLPIEPWSSDSRYPAECAAPAPTAEEVKALADKYARVVWDYSRYTRDEKNAARNALHAAIDRLTAAPVPVLTDELRSLLNAAREVRRLGATTGSQWTRLDAACLKAETALATKAAAPQEPT